VDGRPFSAPPRHALAVKVVRHVGEAVAVVVAESESAAQDAVERVDVDYEEHGVVVDPRESEDYAFLWGKGDAAATAEAFAGAAHVVDIEAVNNRILISPLEPRGAIGCYDANGYVLYAPTQGVHLVRRLVAPTLGVEPSELRVVTHEVGGSFGSKLVNAPEQTAVLAAARITGRPVRWVASRAESHLTDVAGRDHVSKAWLALDADFRILGLKVETWGNLGAYASALSPSTHTSGFAATLCGPYRIPCLHLTVHGVYTNTTPTDAFRGSGKPESVYLLERLIDRAARTLRIGRVELRRRNLIGADEMPYKAANGVVYDSADFPAVLDAALVCADWSGFGARRAASEKHGKCRGIGLGLYLHTTGVTSQEISRVRVDARSFVAVETGLQSSGQGHETAFAQLIGEKLGLEPRAIRIVQGDTAVLADAGGPTAGSSSLQVGGVTMLRAADAMLEAGRRLAAERLEASAGDVVYEPGRFIVAGTDRAIGLFELAAALETSGEAGCAGEARLDGNILTIPNGAYVCEVEVDPETGHVDILRFVGVDDIGNRLNPLIAEGQIHGGIAQGIGQALHEHAVYEDGTGQLLSGTMMDYGLPRAADLPFFDLAAADRPTANNPLGMKGAGEIGCIGAPAAVVNAVADAIGQDRIDMPATPARLWAALATGTDRP
jgi:carbon-monoxide dehydrogenase large subunit